MSIGEGGIAQKLKIIYRLMDDEKDFCSLDKVEWSDNGGNSWHPCIQASNPGPGGNSILDGDGTQNLSSHVQPNGKLHSFVWDISKEQFLTGNKWVLLRIVPRDAYGIGAEVQKLFPISGWLREQQVPSANVDGTVSLVADVKGNLHAFWEEGTGNQEVMYSRFNGASWSSPVNLSNDPSLTWGHKTAIDKNGNLHVVWVRSGEIYYTRSIDGELTWDGDLNTPGNQPLQISVPPANSSGQPAIALDSSGNPHVVWRQSGKIMYSSFNGTSWSTPIDISNGSTVGWNPHIAVQENNQIYVVWQNDNTGNTEIYFNKFNGTSWTGVQNISSTSAASYGPQIALDPSGALYVVWQEGNSGYNSEIYYASSKDGGSNWSSPLNLSNNPGDSFSPQIRVNSQGEIYIIWNDKTSGPEEIYYAELSHGSWSSPRNLSNSPESSNSPFLFISTSNEIFVSWKNSLAGTGSFHFQKFPQEFTPAYVVFPTYTNSFNHNMFVDSSRNIHFSWTLNGQIFYLRGNKGGSSYTDFDPNTGGIQPALISNQATQTVAPSLTADSSGTIYVVWQHSFTSPEIYYSKSTDGGSTWDGDPNTPGSQPLNLSNTPTLSRGPKMVEKNGNLFVVWREFISPQNKDEVYFRRFDGSAWLSVTNISSTSTVNSDQPSLAVEASGTIHVVWREGSGSGTTEIFYSKSTDGGVNWDGNPNTPGNQPLKISGALTNSEQPAIALDKSGFPVVVWKDGSDKIYWNRWDGTNWVGPAQIPLNGMTSVYYPQIGVDSQDNVHLAFYSSYSGKDQIYYLKYQNGQWSIPINIVNTMTTALFPNLAVDGQDNIYISWQDDNLGDGIYFAKSLTPLPLHTQDFQSVIQPALPAGWQAPNGGWISETGNKIGSSNTYAVVSNTATNADLISPVIDCSKAASVYLQFDQNFSATTTGSQIVTVDISNDGGTTWNPVPPSSTGPPVVQMTEKTGNNTNTIRLNISHYASGQAQVQIRFRYNNTGTDGFWAVDNIKVEQKNSFSG
ncbi:MAG: hypothetical protein D6785_02765 [Planctomycetota bacterium]|nr:MAG: hypothetical protein D6785_02765 [Planctomycetota bacterium]